MYVFFCSKNLQQTPFVLIAIAICLCVGRYSNEYNVVQDTPQASLHMHPHLHIHLAIL